MTGYTVHTGSTEQFSEGWDRIFGNAAGQPRKTAAKKSAGGTKTAKNRAKPAAAKKKRS
jgi:hypothetical protein